MNTNAMEVFKSAFLQTSGVSMTTYSLSIRLIAAVLICIAAVLVVSHFLNGNHKESDTFVLDLTGFGAKVFIAVCFSLLFLIY
ncbi:TPA: hypothetical protein ACWM1T_001805 [Legionella pneumophila]|nr:hypothetical protein [Legionella pneumophila]HBD7283623.1 hypothetical protein [Legionella pneumophila]HBD9439223.1 hypothetical protein [Legionella pneumophila]HEN8241142.1 hypothetical protein [Legionella pneumophila]